MFQACGAGGVEVGGDGAVGGVGHPRDAERGRIQVKCPNAQLARMSRPATDSIDRRRFNISVASGADSATFRVTWIGFGPRRSS